MRLDPLGIQVDVRGKKLGITFTANARRATAAQRARVAAASGRTAAVKKLARAAGRRAAGRVLRAGVLASS